MLLSLLETSALDKASCSCEQSYGVEISLYNFVSPAYSPVDVDPGMTSGRSLMKSKKSIGPKTRWVDNNKCNINENTILIYSSNEIIRNITALLTLQQ